MDNYFKINNIYNTDCIKSMKKLSDESIDLVIADPPYWKVVSEKWDYQWKTEQDYIKWSLQWIKEVARILRKGGGSFYCFGYFRTLALLVPYLEDLGLELRQQIILDKGIKAISGRATKNYKMFPNVTESILFIVKDNKKFIRFFLKECQRALGLSSKQINEALGVIKRWRNVEYLYRRKYLQTISDKDSMGKTIENSTFPTKLRKNCSDIQFPNGIYRCMARH